MSFWLKVLDLTEQSVLFQGILAVSVVGGVVYLSCTGQSIPEQLGSLAMIIVGFFFGSKSTAGVARATRDTINTMRGKEC